MILFLLGGGEIGKKLVKNEAPEVLEVNHQDYELFMVMRPNDGEPVAFYRHQGLGESKALNELMNAYVTVNPF